MCIGGGGGAGIEKLHQLGALRWISLNKREGDRNQHKHSPPAEKPGHMWRTGGLCFAQSSQRGVGGEFVK